MFDRYQPFHAALLWVLVDPPKADMRLTCSQATSEYEAYELPEEEEAFRYV